MTNAEIETKDREFAQSLLEATKSHGLEWRAIDVNRYFTQFNGARLMTQRTSFIHSVEIKYPDEDEVRRLCVPGKIAKEIFTGAKFSNVQHVINDHFGVS